MAMPTTFCKQTSLIDDEMRTVKQAQVLVRDNMQVLMLHAYVYMCICTDATCELSCVCVQLAVVLLHWQSLF